MQLQGLMEQLGFQKEQWEYMKQVNAPYLQAGAYAMPQVTGPDQMTDIQTTASRLNALRDPLYGTGSYPATQTPYPVVGSEMRADPGFRESVFNPPAPAAPERRWIPESTEKQFIAEGGYSRATGEDRGKWVDKVTPGRWEELPPGAGNALADRREVGPPSAPIQLHDRSSRQVPTNALGPATTANQIGDQPIIPEVLERDETDPFTLPLDEESPYYTWQQEQGEKALNRAMSARGKYDSSTAVNALSDFNRALGAEETERQYGRRVDAYGRRVDEYSRRYGRIMDEYNLKNQGYNRLMDLIRIGQSASGQEQLGATEAGRQIGSTYGNMGTARAGGELRQGEAWGQFWGGAGGVPANALSQYYMMNALKPPPTAAPAWNPYATGSYQSRPGR
jgi:hypothetical protein